MESFKLKENTTKQKNMKPILFVAFSHQLQTAQIEGLKAQYGIESDNVVLLSEVNSELAAQCQQIDPSATLEQVKELAAFVVVEAHKVGATHFYCAGEPTLAMWANLYASAHSHSPQYVLQKITRYTPRKDGGGWFFLGEIPFMSCIVSTTRRESVDVVQSDGSIKKSAIFNHVQWRALF
jgi:hypothetical protein